MREEIINKNLKTIMRYKINIKGAKFFLWSVEKSKFFNATFSLDRNLLIIGNKV